MAFDIDKYTANSTAVGWDDLDFDEFDRTPLPASTLRILRYMCDVEYHTVCYLRDLLTTPSHKEPEIGAFMTMWNREEFWHGEALSAVLAKHGIGIDVPHPGARCGRRPRRAAKSLVRQHDAHAVFRCADRGPCARRTTADNDHVVHRRRILRRGPAHHSD